MIGETLGLNHPLEGELRRKRARGRKNYAWSGIFLLIVGLSFFLKNAGLLGDRFNWWAFFILMPAIFLLNAATTSFLNSGFFSLIVRATFSMGLITLTVAVMFLLNLDWSVWWALMLVVPGMLMVLNSLSSRWRAGFQTGSFLACFFWLGLSTALLGLAFLFDGLHVIDLSTRFGLFPWWGLAILLPGIGFLLSAFINYRRAEGQANFENSGLMVGGLVFCCVSSVALLRLDWNLLSPLLLILAGILLLLKYYYEKRSSIR